MDCEDRLSLWEQRVWTHVDGTHHDQGNDVGDQACGTSEWTDGRLETAHCAKEHASMDGGVQNNDASCFSERRVAQFQGELGSSLLSV